MKRELRESSKDYMQQLGLIDAIRRLGIEHHFEVEIDEALQNIFEKFDGYCKDNDDMYITVLGFRLRGNLILEFHVILVPGPI
ncbi:hypothetical protein BUALT_Bualt13G0015500 [Buddleja alternifolia]|uniref:Terpene synthase N-terminal domain-containing protein n=1 Tax=Buddleja alternifolia TaxID=168488 RepID=A0AAV6WPB0_9LAMI|nr:hypothetical protein BUALT_Bualt13G0015500 [Buddleja alternifolia]